MNDLRSTIEQLASRFAGNVIEALRRASIDELMDVAGARGAARRGQAATRDGASRPSGGRLGRRTADDIAHMVDDIVTLLTKHSEGMRAEQLREALGVEAKELPRPLSDALASGRVTKTGQKRATTYFASGSGDGATAAPRRRGGRGRKKKG